MKKVLTVSFERDFFLRTERIGFSKWTNMDAKLAESLWGDPEVTKYICASGIFMQTTEANASTQNTMPVRTQVRI